MRMRKSGQRSRGQAYCKYWMFSTCISWTYSSISWRTWGAYWFWQQATRGLYYCQSMWSRYYCTNFGGDFSNGRRGEQCGYLDSYVICFNDILMFTSRFDSFDSLCVESQAQLGLLCEHTLRVNGHSNGQESPLSFVALTMSHRIILYDT